MLNPACLLHIGSNVQMLLCDRADDLTLCELTPCFPSARCAMAERDILPAACACAGPERQPHWLL